MALTSGLRGKYDHRFFNFGSLLPTDGNQARTRRPRQGAVNTILLQEPTWPTVVGGDAEVTLQAVALVSETSAPNGRRSRFGAKSLAVRFQCKCQGKGAANEN